MIRKSLALTAAVVLVSAITAMACGAGSQPGQKTSALINTETPQQVTLKGQLTCSSCALKSKGALSSCSEFGCSYALKTADGRFVSLLQNKFSKDLIGNKKNHNKPVEITGTYFANANVLDVKSYSLGDGDKISWCDHCKGMDACKAAMGGSH